MKKTVAQFVTWMFTFFFLWVLPVGCTKKSTPVPPGIIQPAEMVSILADIHIAQAAVAVRTVSDSAFRSLEDYKPIIFGSHHITQEKYDQSMEFYTGNPELLDSIYKYVIDELSRRQGEAEALKN